MGEQFDFGFPQPAAPAEVRTYVRTYRSSVDAQQLRLDLKLPMHWGIRLKHGFRPACRMKSEACKEPTTRYDFMLTCPKCIAYYRRMVAWGSFHERKGKLPSQIEAERNRLGFELQRRQARARAAEPGEARPVPSFKLEGGRLTTPYGERLESFSEREASARVPLTPERAGKVRSPSKRVRGSR